MRYWPDKRLQQGKGFQMVEVMMTKEDAPESLKKLVNTVKKRNSGAGQGEEESAKEVVEKSAIQ